MFITRELKVITFSDFLLCLLLKRYSPMFLITIKNFPRNNFCLVTEKY